MVQGEEIKMGTYNLDAEEIADMLEDWEDDGEFEGDFTEEVLIDGVKLFCKKLRKRGANIPKK
jgi:hypothetical protein